MIHSDARTIDSNDSRDSAQGTQNEADATAGGPAAFTARAHTTTAAAPAAYATAATAALSPAAGTGDVAPLAAIRITEEYGVRGPWAAGHHTGIDLAAAPGTSVRSVGAGTVVRSGSDGAYGIDVLMKLSDGKYGLYAHLSQASVFSGEQVTAGRQLGLSGATGPHLHFEVRTTPSYGSDIGPAAYLRAHGVIL